MRTAFRFALVSLLLLPAAAAAQSGRDKVQVQFVRIGFPPGPQLGDTEEEVIGSGQRPTLHKPGAWTPVYVTVINNGKYDPDPKKDGPAEVVVEVYDCDDTAHNYTVPLPPIKVDDPPATVVAYTRAGSRYSDFTVRVQTTAGRELCQATKTSTPGLDPQEILYLALGSRLPGLRLPGQAANRNPNPDQSGGRAEAAVLTRVPELPPHWLGYGAADVVILATGDRTFMNSLIGDSTRTAALAEWVRRGGRLLILAGANHDVLNGSPDLKALLPADIDPKGYKAQDLTLFWKEGGAVAVEPLPRQAQGLELPKLLPRDKPARGYRVLMDAPKAPGADASPLIVQGPYGLGQVTLSVLALDREPFIHWPGRAAFWEQLLTRAGPRVSVNVVNQPNYRYGPRGAYGPEAEADAQLQAINQQLESFEGVPVISFGWVALFILLYILVVGPLDYLFLKKVVKRLELTWVTFPTVVLAVSAAAYFTAYYLKGSDLRINKLDLVDIDLQTQRAYGRTWFSVFSPRIQKYTVGVEPAAGWAVPERPGLDTAVSWFGVPKQSRQSLFRHSYDYAPLAEGLRGVPIQVWTTKGFQASWQAPLAKDRPAFESRLRHPPGKPDDLIGSVVSHLPAPLEDAALIYRGEVARLGTLLPDAPKAVTAQTRVKFSAWLSGAEQPADTAPGDQGFAKPVVAPPDANSLHVSLLFAEAAAGRGDPNNASLREVDQSWRVDEENRDEVILVGRLRQEQGDAEAITAGPASPSRLWLGELPSSGQPRPPLAGRLRQDTVVRVFIPIAPEPRPGGITTDEHR
jgi:hypothetical protein